MKAAIFRGKGKIEIEERPDPEIVEQTDAVVRVVLACVCGSDLWFYRGISPHPIGGTTGHEFIGRVEEVGSKVSDIKKGDLVIATFRYSDGTCAHCKAGYQTSCVNGGFFGTGKVVDGGQSEYVRVPHADGSLVAVKGKKFSEETLASLMALSDVMGTGYHAAVSAEVKKGQTVVVIGDGAVGLCGVIATKMLGAKRIINLGSSHKSRQTLAKEFGATDIVSKRGEDGIKEVMKLTDGVGADAVLECVGTADSYKTAFDIARPGAIVGRVGVPHDAVIPVGDMFFTNVGTRGGVAPVRSYTPKLLEAVLKGEINPGKVFDFKTDFKNIKDAYKAMDERRAIKSILKVSEL